VAGVFVVTGMFVVTPVLVVTRVTRVTPVIGMGATVDMPRVRGVIRVVMRPMTLLRVGLGTGRLGPHSVHVFA
jgi:hypothetical protein